MSEERGRNWSWASWLDVEDAEFAAIFATAKSPEALLADLAQWPGRLVMGRESEFRRVGEAYIHETAELGQDCRIEGPAYIGPGVKLGLGAYVRGPVLMGRGSRLGHCSELKHSVLMYAAELPHFNYVGDSILGEYVHLGAGAIVSNLRQDQGPVQLRLPEGNWDLGRRKFGALLGAHVEIGCQAVLAPGVSIGQGSRVYPLCFVRGALPAGYLLKRTGDQAQPIRRA